MDNMMVFSRDLFRFPKRNSTACVLGVLGVRSPGLMIAAGAALIHRFEWIAYVFGAPLIITAVK
jgi:tellurite resistance protein TerC